MTTTITGPYLLPFDETVNMRSNGTWSLSSSYLKGALVQDATGIWYRAVRNVPSSTISLGDTSYWVEFLRNVYTDGVTIIGAGTPDFPFAVAASDEVYLFDLAENTPVAGTSTYLLHFPFDAIYVQAIMACRVPPQGSPIVATLRRTNIILATSTINENEFYNVATANPVPIFTKGDTLQVTIDQVGVGFAGNTLQFALYVRRT